MPCVESITSTTTSDQSAFFLFHCVFLVSLGVVLFSLLWIFTWLSLALTLAGLAPNVVYPGQCKRRELWRFGVLNHRHFYDGWRCLANFLMVLSLKFLFVYFLISQTSLNQESKSHLDECSDKLMFLASWVNFRWDFLAQVKEFFIPNLRGLLRFFMRNSSRF